MFHSIRYVVVLYLFCTLQTGCVQPAAPVDARRGELAQDPVRDLRWDSRVIAAQAGYYATPAPGQAGAFTGADLGWTFAHRDKLWVMFGDSWWIDPVNAASLPDDALGQISLTDFPDGPAVDAFVAAHPAGPGQPAWRAAGPTMPVFVHPGAGFAPVISERDGQKLPSGIGNTPVTGFSNGRDDAAEGVFAQFYNFAPVECAAGRCADGFECDPQLGRDALTNFNPPCVVGSSPSCQPGPGLCQDRQISLYNANAPVGRTMSVVLRHSVAMTTPDSPLRWSGQAFDTARFSNATSRTVTDFDPSRALGTGNDYTPARGNDLPHAGVFVWGRPSFGGVGIEGRDSQLYLMWAPLPAADAERHFSWQPQYFTGLDPVGRPQLSARQSDARPLDLDAETPGDQPTEVRDVIGQMAVAWLPSLSRWVMIYGGEGADMFGDPVLGADTTKIRHDPDGSLFIRFAEQPWGPWTPPRAFLQAGDKSPNAVARGLYAPGGVLAHNNCLGADCARYDPAYLLDVGRSNNGILYGPNIIDPWTTAHDDGQLDVYWFVSTWNPYQVLLMKTTFTP